MGRTWRRRVGRLAVGPMAWLAVGLLVWPGVARAHEVGGSRFDLPIPPGFLFVGAGATVGLTALWLGVTERQELALDVDRPVGAISPSSAATLRAVAGLGFLALAGLSLAHGIVGEQTRAENLATLFVWPVWIEGVALVAILAGSPWRVLSPWRTLYDGLTVLEGEEIAVLGEYPSWLGEWPALVGFVVWLGIVENLTIIPRSPRLTVVLVAGYALVMLLGGVAFGREWFERADVLSVLYRVFGRAAPVRADRTDDGGYRIGVRPPWRGATVPVRSLALVAFVVATVYTISFDGFAGTPEYQTLLFGARDFLSLGQEASVLLYLLGLAGFVGSFFLVVVLVERFATGSVGGWRRAALAFAPTVIPITVAYELAHNYPFVIRNAWQFLAVLADPGAAASVAPLGWLSLPAFWGSQVVLVVAGHVVAVVAAHLVASRRYDSPRETRRGHLPLAVLMVGYTVLSLWIVSRPVVAV